MTKSPFMDSGLAIPVFSPGYDPIAFLNKEMAFLIAIVSSRFPSTNHQLRTSFNLRNHATIQDGKTNLDEEQLAFLADPEIPDGQAIQTIIPNNDAFQTEDLDTYDSDCDDISNAKAILMANISNYGFDVLLEETQQETVQDTNLQAQQDSMILSVIEKMSKQMINHVNNWEKANKDQNSKSVIAELERYKETVKTFE
nr:hypothetical protein [Tanacetum cinerariifolium]